MRVLPESDDQNPLKQYFYANEGRLMFKWAHYFDIYHNHFRRFRDDPDRRVTLVEIGVAFGGSMQMWKHYFGGRARIVGVDINPRCKQLEEDGIEVHIGSQEDRKFLVDLAQKIGPIDILIDDGGHTFRQQNITFDIMYPRVVEDGIFLVEDLHTSYWATYDGGYRKGDTFIERTKGFIDCINGYHSRGADFGPTHLTRTATGLHFYDSVLVIEKCPNPQPPRSVESGKNPFTGAA